MATSSEPHLRLTDMRDREVLGILNDSLSEVGWADSQAIAKVLWPNLMTNGNGDGQRAATSAVGGRLAWMSRIGVVERYKPEPGEPKPPMNLWRPTAEGEDLLNGRLTANAERTLETLEGARVVLAVHALAERKSDDLIQALMKRAWKYGMGARA